MIQIGNVTIDTLQGTSLLGKPLIRRQVDTIKDSLQIAQYIDAYNNYIKDTTNKEAIIWVGRRIAYLGDYQQAIRYYTKGIYNHPVEARFYRHRGHRYITTRQFDKAINDFNRAVQLIENTEDQVEQDGIPNRLNTPVSTLHNNIFYHLSLAHYVKNELPNALMAFQNCLNVSKNDDMQVATRHWLYMIHRRLGNTEIAAEIIEPINKDMNIIENDAYHQLLLFYKGELSETALTGSNSTGSSEAVQYGLANWYHYNGNIEKATELYQALVDNGNWAGFGFVAAEGDLSRLLVN
jgi:tetratricopeptide (TPR) repeat protein